LCVVAVYLEIDGILLDRRFGKPDTYYNDKNYNIRQVFSSIFF